MQQMMNLFNTSSSVAGYRLDYMEVWNWGTFDKEVFRISPKGNNTLLTGANASGKSTFIDALLTLLVPLKRNRFYNQSSGVEKKGDRTEESYFFGNYGNQQQEGSVGTKTLRLRDKSSRSVLLACFKSADDRVITLFQVRYFSGEELKTVYGIARTALQINEDLVEFDAKGVWRRHLEKKYNAGSVKKIVDFCSGPVEYGEQICDLFGMKSDKALQLFNQIVGVKVLDDLDYFIRENMLEEMDAEAKYIELKENFQNLMEAKLSIDKANEQIAQLKPIVSLADELEKNRENINRLEEEKNFAAYWFAQKTVKLCTEQLHQINSDLKLLHAEINKLDKQITELDNDRTQLRVSIENDAVGKQVRELEEAVRQLEEKRDVRKKKAELYNQLIQEVKLAVASTAADFNKNREQAAAEKERLQQSFDNELSKQLRQQEQCHEEVHAKIEEHVKDIKYLELHRRNITGRIAEIREEILQHTGATTEEMPFIGELIQVKSEEQAWETSIEKILHHFALRLLVPESYYDQVNRYVNEHNLKGRLVYQQYKDYTSLRTLENWEVDDNSLLNKIEIKPGSRYSEWIEDAIYREYNYACVANLEEFACYDEKAVTQEGLIKSVKGKHEKDDRDHVVSKENFVLGWDNREKIRSLQDMVRQLQEEERNIVARKQEINDTIKRNNQQKEALSQLYYAFTDFDEIDWQSYVVAIQEKLDAKKQLEDANDTIKVLQQQLADVEQKLKALQEDKNKLSEQTYRHKTQAEQLQAMNQENQKFINQMGDVDSVFFELQHPELNSIGLDQLHAKRDEFQRITGGKIAEQKAKLNTDEKKVSKLINLFKNPSEEITARFRDWRSDVSSLPESEHLELIGEYKAYYQRLVDEDLVSFGEQFNKYLQETITHHVHSFRIFFQTWEENIKRTIDQLNAPLREIDFDTHPTTYIQLIAGKKLDVEVQEFIRLMEAAVPNVHEMETTVDGRKLHFENHIEPFIKRLEDEVWRNKVTDVRSWFTYKAEEYFKENQQRRKTYESMGQLSGGEKAQLTYTILGSAIACQFGLTKSGLDSSFRFIAIDEAFKAQDETKARYLLSLCRQLHLQLLVVTPSDNIHIVENDISYVHYVERQGDRSVLYNMPIMEFKEQRTKQIDNETNQDES